MREGAWIDAYTGSWYWITEHASWIQDPENAKSLGLDVETHSRLAAIGWDFNGPGREAILRVAMTAGFIRVRGHGASVTFEFTLPIAEAIEAVRPFMDQHFGPLTGCVFNNLATGSFLAIGHGALQLLLERQGAQGLLDQTLLASEPMQEGPFDRAVDSVCHARNPRLDPCSSSPT